MDPGQKIWAFATGFPLVLSSPAIGSDGTVYVGAYDYNLYAINPDGSKKWEFETGGEVPPPGDRERWHRLRRGS